MTRVSRSENISLSEKFCRFSWPLFGMMSFVLVFSMLALFSAGNHYAWSQLGKIIIGFAVFFITAFSNIKIWLKSSYIIYGAAAVMVLLVLFLGHTGMGAQRWLNLGFMHIQPSEFIKIALVIALARNFAWQNSTDVQQIKNYLVPIILFIIPFILIVLQPDLGTAMSLAIIAAGMFWIAGAKRQWFVIVGILLVLTAPAVWYGGMHGYQRERILTFINPGHDILGAGYQINQAKIAFGSGGMIGKGYMQGTQSHQSFLPEKQTDFIFTMLGEELGFTGAFVLLMIYLVILGMLFWIAKTCRNRFGQLVVFGFMLNFFVYYFINIAMVLGLLPTVGVPLPLVSFGGSALLSLMFGFGLCQNAYINKEQQLSAKGY